MKALHLAALFLAGGLSGAASAAPATQPSVPVNQIPVPALRMADVAPSKVVVLPFAVLGGDYRDWVGRAVQESLASDVARLGGMFPISAASPAGPLDTAAARDAGKSYGGDTVVFGSYQFVGGDVRLTGQVVSVGTGRALGGLKASGDFRDLFELEDELAGQLRHALRPPLSAPSATPARGAGALIFGLQPRSVSGEDVERSVRNSNRYADAYNRYYYDRGDYTNNLYTGGYGYPVYPNYDYDPYDGFYGYPSSSGPVVIVVRNGRNTHGPVMNRPISSGPPFMGRARGGLAPWNGYGGPVVGSRRGR